MNPNGEAGGMGAEIVVLRVVHVLGGVFWVGTGLFSTFFLVPALKHAGPAAGVIMASMQQRRLFIVMPTVAVITMLAGLRLMWITSAGFSATYFATARGLTYGWSGAAAIVAFFVALMLGRPTAVRLGEIQKVLASTTDDRERSDLSARAARLQRRSAIASWLSLVLLVAATIGMAAARYVV